MGYFSQKKKQNRQSFFLKTAAVFLLILTGLSFFNETSGSVFSVVSSYFYQIYIATFVIFVYSIIIGRRKSAVLFLLILLAGAANISSSANLFKNSTLKNGEKLEVVYDNNGELTFEPQTEIKNYGIVHFGAQEKAYFYTIQAANEQEITFVGLNFVGKSNAEIQKLLTHLKEFTIQRDEPIVLVGYFGVVAWSHEFREFLSGSGFKVKNRIILTDLRHPYNIFSVPSFNILAFKSLGVESIKKQQKKLIITLILK